MGGSTNSATAVEAAGDLAMAILYGMQTLTSVFLFTQLRHRRDQKRIRAYFFGLIVFAGILRCLWFAIPDSFFAQGYQPQNRRPHDFGSQAFLLNALQYVLTAGPNVIYFLNYCLLICTWSSMIHLMFTTMRPATMTPVGAGFGSSGSTAAALAAASESAGGGVVLVQPISHDDRPAPPVKKVHLIAWRTARRFFRFTTLVVCTLQAALVGSLFLFDFFDVLSATCLFVSTLALFSLIGYVAYAIVTVQKLRPMYKHWYQAQAEQMQRAKAKEAAGAPGGGGDHPDLDHSSSRLFSPVAIGYPTSSHRLLRSSMIDTEESFETQAIERTRGGFRGTAAGAGAEASASPMAVGVHSPLVSANGQQLPSYSTAATTTTTVTSTTTSRPRSGGAPSVTRVSSEYSYSSIASRGLPTTPRASETSASQQPRVHPHRTSQQQQQLQVRVSTDDLSYEPTYGEDEEEYEDDYEEEEEDECASESDEEITAAASKHLAATINGRPHHDTPRSASQQASPQAAFAVHGHDSTHLPPARASTISPDTASSATSTNRSSPMNEQQQQLQLPPQSYPNASISPPYQRFPPPSFQPAPINGAHAPASDALHQSHQLPPPALVDRLVVDDHDGQLILHAAAAAAAAAGSGESPRPTASPAPSAGGFRSSARPSRSGSPDATTRSGRSSAGLLSIGSGKHSPSIREDPERAIALYAWHRTRQIGLLTLCVVCCSAARIAAALIELHYTWVQVQQADQGQDDDASDFPSFWWVIIDAYYLLFELLTSTVAMFIMSSASGLQLHRGERKEGVGINQPPRATIIPKHDQGRSGRAHEEKRAGSVGILIPANPSIGSSGSTHGPYSPSMHTTSLHSKLLSASYTSPQTMTKMRHAPTLSSSVAATGGSADLQNAQRIENLRQVFGPKK